MKKLTVIIAVLLCIAVSACGRLTPEKTLDGQTWDRNWVNIGSLIGVDTPEGWSLVRNEDVLAAEGMYYAVWSFGESVSYTDSEGVEKSTFDAQIYMLLAEYDSADSVKENISQWTELADEKYILGEAVSKNIGGLDYLLYPYETRPESAVQGRGVFAVASWGERAVQAELSSLEDFDGDELSTLTAFLARCHYSE